MINLPNWTMVPSPVSSYYKVVDDDGEMMFAFEAKYNRDGHLCSDGTYAKSLAKLKGLTLLVASKDEVKNIIESKKRPNSAGSQILLPGIPSGVKKIKGISHYDAARESK